MCEQYDGRVLNLPAEPTFFEEIKSLIKFCFEDKTSSFFMVFILFVCIGLPILGYFDMLPKNNEFRTNSYYSEVSQPVVISNYIGHVTYETIVTSSIVIINY
jgi:hypothetical protein